MEDYFTVHTGELTGMHLPSLKLSSGYMPHGLMMVILTQQRFT